MMGTWDFISFEYSRFAAPIQVWKKETEYFYSPRPAERRERVVGRQVQQIHRQRRNRPASRRPAILALGKRKIPLGKNIFPLGKRKFPQGKNIFPLGKEKFPLGKDFFLLGKEKFPQGKNIFPLGKEKFPLGKIIFPLGKNFFPNSKGGVFSAKSAVSRPESTF